MRTNEVKWKIDQFKKLMACHTYNTVIITQPFTANTSNHQYSFTCSIKFKDEKKTFMIIWNYLHFPRKMRMWVRAASFGVSEPPASEPHSLFSRCSQNYKCIHVNMDTTVHTIDSNIVKAVLPFLYVYVFCVCVSWSKARGTWQP